MTQFLLDLINSTKKKLTCMLAEGLQEHFPKEKFIFFQMVVVYDTFIKDSDSVETHTHEEADTLIPHQVLAAVAGNPNRKIDVFSPDTDVLLLLFKGIVLKIEPIFFGKKIVMDGFLTINII